MTEKDYSTFWQTGNGFIVFKVLGFGIWAGSYEMFPPLFSERNGYTTAWPIFPGWRLILLAPWK